MSLPPLLLVALIFFARVVDVSMGTVRTITVVRGYRWTSGVIGFFEVLIWIIASGQVLKNIDKWYLIVAYAGGFAAGNMVGIWLESKVALGTVMVTAISENPDISLCKALREEGYTVTQLEGRGYREASVEIALIAYERRELPHLIERIKSCDPDVFFTTQDIRNLYQSRLQPRRSPGLFTGWRSIMKKK